MAWLRVWAVNKEGHREKERWSSWNTDVCEYRTKLENDRPAAERAFKSLSKRNSKGFSQSPYPIFQRHHSMCMLICTHMHAYLYTRACVLSCFSPVPLFATPWTVTHHAPLPMEFSRQEYWSGLPCPYPGNLPDLGIEAVSPALKALSLLLSHGGSPGLYTHTNNWLHIYLYKYMQLFHSCHIPVFNLSWPQNTCGDRRNRQK